MVMM
jgi:hypothetical protein